MPLKVYTLAQCSTCRKATKWLRDHDVDFEEHPIRQTPPPPAELRAMLAATGGELRRLFNTGSQDYRDLKLAERVGRMSADEAIALFQANGNLVKRPFVTGDGVALVGFDEARWASAFKAR